MKHDLSLLTFKGIALSLQTSRACLLFILKKFVIVHVLVDAHDF